MTLIELLNLLQGPLTGAIGAASFWLGSWWERRRADTESDQP